MRAASSALAILLLVGGSASALAEPKTYEQIRAEGGLTFSRGAVEGRRGFGFSTEVKGLLHDNLAVGARVEVAFLFGGVVGEQDAALSFGLAAAGLAKVEYLYGTHLLRPFVGLGAGVYNVGAQTIDTGDASPGFRSAEGRYFGVAPQVGLDIGRLRLGLTYNAIIGAALHYRESVGATERETKISRNYLSLEVSFQFTGGKKATKIPTAQTSR